MAWTTPRTWVTDELVTAALMNTHVRDNFNAVPHLLVYKSADESVVSSSTMQDDNHLFYALGANDLWYLSVVMVMTGDSPTPGASIGFTIPTSATMTLTAAAYNVNAAFSQMHWTTSNPSVGMLVIAGGNVIIANGIVETAATAGNFQVQFSQNVSSGTPVVMKKGSAIYGLQLA